MCLSFLCDEVRLLLLMLPGTAGGLVVVPLMPTKIAAKMYDCRLMMAMMVVVMTSDCQWHATFWPWTFNRVLIWIEEGKREKRTTEMTRERECVNAAHLASLKHTRTQWMIFTCVNWCASVCMFVLSRDHTDHAATATAITTTIIIITHRVHSLLPKESVHWRGEGGGGFRFTSLDN